MIELSVPASATDQLLYEAERNPDVIELAVFRGASVKPPGDVLRVSVLNKGTDEILQLLDTAREYGAASVSMSELSAIVDAEQQEAIEGDEDEATWEEMESGLRHHGHVTINFLVLMALGGAAATIGLVEDRSAQAVAFVAAAMLTPGYEPLAKIPLGALLGRWHVVLRGLKSALAGYAVLIIGAALTFRILMALGVPSALKLERSSEVRALSLPDAKAIGLSILGGLAGMLIISAYRRSVIAGPLILLAIIPAAALVGAALSCGKIALAMQGVERLALDVAIIWVTGAIVVAFKQATFHRTRKRSLV